MHACRTSGGSLAPSYTSCDLCISAPGSGPWPATDTAGTACPWAAWPRWVTLGTHPPWALHTSLTEHPLARGWQAAAWRVKGGLCRVGMAPWTRARGEGQTASQPKGAQRPSGGDRPGIRLLLLLAQLSPGLASQKEIFDATPRLSVQQGLLVGFLLPAQSPQSALSGAP